MTTMHGEGYGFGEEMLSLLERLEGNCMRATYIIIQRAINGDYWSNCGSLRTFHLKITALRTIALPPISPTTFSFSLDPKQLFLKFIC
jgi:hypothetical protein